jgi:hypothetical protein
VDVSGVFIRTFINVVYYREAQKEVQNIALDANFSVPGDPGFPLNQVCSFHFLILISDFHLPFILFIIYLTDTMNRSSHLQQADKKPKLSANTSHKCAKNWLQDYWRECMKTAVISLVSGG